MLYKHYNINISYSNKNFKIIIGVDIMRKCAIILLTFFILLGSVSCKTNVNKKIIKDNHTPEVQENIEDPKPADSRQDQELSEKIENVEKEDSKNAFYRFIPQLAYSIKGFFENNNQFACSVYLLLLKIQLSL